MNSSVVAQMVSGPYMAKDYRVLPTPSIYIYDGLQVA